MPKQNRPTNLFMIRLTPGQRAALEAGAAEAGVDQITKFARDAMGKACEAVGVPWPADPEHGGYRPKGTRVDYTAKD